MSFILNLSTLIKFCQLSYCEMDFYTSFREERWCQHSDQEVDSVALFSHSSTETFFLDSRCMGVSRILLHKKFFLITIFTPQIAVTK